MDDALTNALQQLLEDHCTPALIRAVEAGAAPADFWATLEASGFADALVPEGEGGAGLSLPQAFPLLELCGRHALPVPLAQTMLVRALLAQEGRARPAGSIAIATEVHDVDGDVVAAHVPYGRVADWVFVPHGPGTVLLPGAMALRTPAVFPLDASLRWRAQDVVDGHTTVGMHDGQALLGCSLAAQLSGALMEVFRRTLDHANTREQFGRPIGKFQAIQHQLSVLAEHTFAARMAAQIGCNAAAVTPDCVCVAIAKSRTSDAALECATLAHSIHGAIGFTAEFDLQLFTRRLHSWRQAGGAESYWQTVLGEALVDNHPGLTLDLIRSATQCHSTSSSSRSTPA